MSIRLVLVVCLALASTASAADGCKKLEVDRWERSELLEIQVATQCRYQMTWTGWSPPRSYDYRPDADGWISDYFIVGDQHGQVYWNLRTNAVVVRPRAGHALDLAGAREVAQHAKGTNFPGLDLGQLDFSPSSFGFP